MPLLPCQDKVGKIKSGQEVVTWFESMTSLKKLKAIEKNNMVSPLLGIQVKASR